MKSQSNARPHLACELGADYVVAARSDRGAISVSGQELAPGILLPNLTAANLGDFAAVRNAVETAMAGVAERSRDVIAIVPDSAVRVTLLDFDALPEKRQEAESMVRFRLKKSLPFDVEQAAVSYDVRRQNGSVKVVAVVVLRSILEEYESVFLDAGFNPGIVLPSMLSALGCVQADEPTMVIKVDQGATTISIVNGNQLLLMRTLENAPGALVATQLAEDIYPSLVFFEDNYFLQVRNILVSGRAVAEAVGPALEAQTGAKVSDLSPENGTGDVPGALLAGVMGALKS